MSSGDKNYEVITKLDAGERQLRGAIRLLFERKDAVVVHTVAAAARDILEGLAKQRGFVGTLSPSRLDNEENWTFRNPQNFFKHAVRDVKNELVFLPEITLLLLYDAARLHWKLSGRLCPETSTFLFWYWGKHPLKKYPEMMERVKKFSELDFAIILRLIDGAVAEDLPMETLATIA